MRTKLLISFVSIASLLLIQACNSSSGGGGGGGTPAPDNGQNSKADITSLVVTVSDTDHTVSFDDARQATINYPYGSAAPATIVIKSISLVADATSDYDSGGTIGLNDGKAIITVTAQDGTEQTYTIRIVAEKNSGAVITSLTLKLIDSTSDSSKSISFDATTTEVTIEYQYTQATAPDTIQLTSIDMSAGAIASIGDKTTDGSNDLPVDIAITGANPSVAIVVTAEDGSTSSTYTVTISLTRVNPDSLKEITDLDISLSLGTESFEHTNIAFNEESKATVSTELPYGTSEADFPDSFTIDNIAVSGGADASPDTDTVNIDNSQGQRTATITVTAADDTTQVYTLIFTFTIAKNTEANINTLVVTVSGTDHTLDFDENEQATINYPYGVAPANVTIKSISLSAEATSNYGTGATIDVSNDQVTITVTSQDGTAAQAYTINLVMLPNTAAEITSLIVTVSGDDHTIVFGDNRQASVDKPYSLSDLANVTIKSISISAEATADYATGATLNLAVNNTATITITAQDGKNQQTYTISFIKFKTLRDILDSSVGGTSTVPVDLSGYDELTNAVLAPYSANANLIARYVTIAGGAATTPGGTSWSDAAPASQLEPILDGISDASSDRVYLLLVASGASADQSYDAGKAMKMKNHVAIIGGWDAIGGWGRSGTTIISGGGLRVVFINIYNATSPIDSTALLYGLTISAGQTSAQGGGIFNNSSSPTLTNITFSNNLALSGGGISNNSSSPTMTNIIFSNNSALSGGGISNENSSSPTMTNVTFSDNSALSGGGMYNYKSSPTLTNITFFDNSADHGGGMYNYQSSSSIINATFAGNKAINGGGLYILQRKATTIVGSIFWGNTATNGAQILINDVTGDTITLAYSVIQGGAPADITTSTNLVTIDPSLSDLTTDADSAVATHAISTGSSAINAGVYVRRLDYTDQSDDAQTAWYYSEDNNNWYTGFDSSGLTDSTSDTVATAEGSIDITATDATGTARSDRPDAGAYEAR